MRKNTEFFPRSLCSLWFNKLTHFFSGSTLQNIIFLVLTPKGSLFNLYYCHIYYPAYLMWNLFFTTHCDKFCTWKSPTIPTFYTNNPYFFTTFLKLLLLHFVEGHLKAWGLKSRGVICFSMWLVVGSPLTSASQQVGHVLIVPIKYLKNSPRSLGFL